MVIGKGYITIAVIHDGVDGTDGANGYTVTATPSVITLGIRKVSDTAFVANVSKNNTSTIRVFKGNLDITSACVVMVASTENCTATGPNAGGSGLIKVTHMSTYTTPSGETYPLTSGSVTVDVRVGGATLSHTIGVSVEMSTVWGGVETTVRGLKSEFGELQKDLQSEAPNVLTKYTSKIEQTAKSISAKVAQETVGRLNVLPGTAFNRETDVEQLNSNFPCKLEPLGGLEGTGAVVVSQTGATTATWCGVVWRDLVLKPSTYYTASVWARVDGGLDDNMYMSFAQKGDSRAFWYMPLATANETFGWKLFTTTFKTSETAAGCNNVTVDLGIRTNGVGRFCKMMLDESDTYNGWTAASYADVSSRALLATGIDIKNKTIDMTADRFTLRNNAGERSMDVDSDGNVVARSLKSVSKDGMLTAVIKDGAFNAKNAMSGASAFFGLVDGLPYLQFTNAAGVVTYAIGATGGRAFGSVKLSLTACNMWSSVADNPVSSDSWLITYGGTITLKNLGQETLSVYKSKLIATIDGFSKKLTPTPSNDSFTMGVTGTNDKMSSVFPGAELVVNFTTITETVKKKNSDGSYNTKPSGYRSVAVVYNNEKIGNGVVK